MASEIVNIIEEIRMEKRVTFRELEEATGIHHVTLRSWRRGDRSPSLAKVETVLDFLGYELEVVKK